MPALNNTETIYMAKTGTQLGVDGKTFQSKVAILLAESSS